MRSDCTRRSELLVEGHFRTLPETPMVDAFLAMSSNRVLNRQVRDGEEGSALEALKQTVANSQSGHVGVRMSPARPLEGSLGLTTPGILESRRRCRPRRDEDRDRRRDDRRDHRGDESLDRDRDRRRDDRKVRERDGRDRRRRDDSR